MAIEWTTNEALHVRYRKDMFDLVEKALNMHFDVARSENLEIWAVLYPHTNATLRAAATMMFDGHPDAVETFLSVILDFTNEGIQHWVDATIAELRERELLDMRKWLMCQPDLSDDDYYAIDDLVTFEQHQKAIEKFYSGGLKGWNERNV